jgi:hypothetical protein
MVLLVIAPACAQNIVSCCMHDDFVCVLCNVVANGSSSLQEHVGYISDAYLKESGALSLIENKPVGGCDDVVGRSPDWACHATALAEADVRATNQPLHVWAAARQVLQPWVAMNGTTTPLDSMRGLLTAARCSGSSDGTRAVHQLLSVLIPVSRVELGPASRSARIVSGMTRELRLLKGQQALRMLQAEWRLISLLASS